MHVVQLVCAALVIGGCTSSPDYVGVYHVTQHDWVAEIMVGGNLDCTAAGSPVSDGDAYFALVDDAQHPDAVQFVRCNDPTACTVQADYAWYAVSGDGDRIGTNAQATVVTSEFLPPTCQLYLETFTVADGATLHLDRTAHEHYDDTADACAIDRALALATQPTCIWVEHFDGERVK